MSSRSSDNNQSIDIIYRHKHVTYQQTHYRGDGGHGEFVLRGQYQAGRAQKR